MIGDGHFEKVNEERNDRNKSSYVWFNDHHKEAERIKLEIGSSVRPHPYRKMKLKSYIHDYLENINENGVIEEYDLKAVIVNTLNIERTFVDKVLAVKRHAICGTLSSKTRHIYDVVQLYKMEEIQYFLSDINNLKIIIELTKKTDAVYLEKRNIPREYNPLDYYGFENWKNQLDEQIKAGYESLHKTLLYSNDKQGWDEAVNVFEEINAILKTIDE